MASSKKTITSYSKLIHRYGFPTLSKGVCNIFVFGKYTKVKKKAI
jgi:hypothetical protein